MEFQSDHYRNYTTDFQAIAQHYSLDPDHLTVEFYTPNQAIFIEEVEDQAYKIHINLEEDRIISFKNLSETRNKNSETIKKKYRKFMR
ncbi:MAG: hypothetical protein ACE5IR_05155 [bacterium]